MTLLLLVVAAVVFLITVVILARAATRPLSAVDISLSRAEQYHPSQPARDIAA